MLVLQRPTEIAAECRDILRLASEDCICIFFPLSPSPVQIEITYADSRGDYALTVDTQAALAGLHLVQAEK